MMLAEPDFYNCWTKLLKQEPAIVCLGKFDAVHLGHQSLIKQGLVFSQHYNLPLHALCFHPHPAEFFNNINMPQLTNLQERSKLLKQYGVDKVFCLRFNQKLATLSAQDFLAKILLQKMQAKAIVVGDDFRFGHKRLGDVNMLQKWGLVENITIAAMTQVFLQKRRVSASWCRESYQDGDTANLQKLIARKNLYCL